MARARPTPEDIARAVQALEDALSSIEDAKDKLEEAVELLAGLTPVKQSAETQGLLNQIEVLLNRITARIAIRHVESRP